jgi:DNA-binding transcriptional regulator YiaG
MTGENLKNIRAELDLTQVEFGELLGYSSKSIQNFEGGWQLITQSMASHVIAILKLHQIKKIVGRSNNV